MSIPNMAGALRGWTKKRSVRIVTKNIINHVIQQTAENVILDIMVQPLQPERVNRKPAEQRVWKWYDVITKSSSRLLKIDDIIFVEGITMRIDSVQQWAEAGYRRYEATEDYTGDEPEEYLP